MNEEYERDVALIVKMELEIREAISKGHKASRDDEFKEYRKLLEELRKKWNLR